MNEVIDFNINQMDYFYDTVISSVASVTGPYIKNNSTVPLSDFHKKLQQTNGDSCSLPYTEKFLFTGYNSLALQTLGPFY